MEKAVGDAVFGTAVGPLASVKVVSDNGGLLVGDTVVDDKAERGNSFFCAAVCDGSVVGGDGRVGALVGDAVVGAAVRSLVGGSVSGDTVGSLVEESSLDDAVVASLVGAAVVDDGVVALIEDSLIGDAVGS